MEPPNKGHVGDNINSAVVSFVERSIILCPYLGGSTVHYESSVKYAASIESNINCHVN